MSASRRSFSRGTYLCMWCAKTIDPSHSAVSKKNQPSKQTTSKQKTSTTRNARGNGAVRNANFEARPIAPLWMWAGAIIAIIGGAYVAMTTRATNGFSSFYIDDAWIHLTFAKTLATTGRFAYGPLAHATSGSTSPLFTLLEAVMFLVTSNEFVIAVSLGVLGLAVASVFFYKIVLEDFKDIPIVAIVATIALATQPLLLATTNWGMETTIAIAMLVMAAWAYESSNWKMLGAAMGLAIWARPDALIFAIALGIDYLYHTRLIRDGRRTSCGELGGIYIFTGLIALYLLFNFALSGSILPNTFAAKLAYYTNPNPNYLSDVRTFLTTRWQGLVFAFALVGSLMVLWNALRLKPAKGLYALLFALGMIGVYWWKLPMLYQDGRYLVPVLPFVLLLAVRRESPLVKLIAQPFGSAEGRQIGIGITFALFVALNLTALPATLDSLAEREAYIHNLQVQTATWCNSHLPKDAVIATHDIGALGYYSGRRIVDIVGLVNPEITPHIGDPKATIDFMHKEGVTHAAFLSNWFDLANENPIYTYNVPNSEVMNVYPVGPTTNFTGPKVLAVHKFIHQALATHNFQSVEDAYAEAIRNEPSNPTTYLLMGEVYLEIQKPAEALEQYRMALSYSPNFEGAIRGIGISFVVRGQQDSARAYLHKALSLVPADSIAARVLSRIGN